MDTKQTLKALKKLDKAVVKETKRFQKMLDKVDKLMAAAVTAAQAGKIHKCLDEGDLGAAVGDLMFETEDEIYALEDAVGADLADDEEEEAADDDSDDEEE